MHKRFYKASLIGGLALALIIILLDQLSKWYVLDVLQLQGRPAIEVTSFFKLVMVWNPGMSFGMLQDIAYGKEILSAVALIIITCLLVWLSRTPARSEIMGIGLVIGGAIGNLIDRFRFGAVADFLYFHINEHYWPAFNIADSAICVGAILLAIYALSSPGKNAKSNLHETPPD